MGLFDSLGGALGNALGQQGGAAAVEGLLSQAGGLDGILKQLNDAGLGQQVNSWLGMGQNMPISADEIEKALGSGSLQQVAGALGIDVSQISGLLAQHLPDTVDKASPNGVLDPNAAGTQQ